MKLENKEIKQAQMALALLLKEMFLVPTKIQDPGMIEMFTEIMLDQAVKSFNELNKLIKDEEER